MRKLGILLVLFLLCSGCGEKRESRGGNSTTGVDTVLEERIAEEEKKEAPATPTPAPAPVVTTLPTEGPEETDSEEAEADIDLTLLSSTMVYSEVYNMMVTPEDYIGKTVRMEGLFTSFPNEAGDGYYYACVILDATACCAQGIEFLPLYDYDFPEDFPAEGETIRVYGIFDTYNVASNRYCTLRDAVIE